MIKNNIEMKYKGNKSDKQENKRGPMEKKEMSDRDERGIKNKTNIFYFN